MREGKTLQYTKEVKHHDTWGRQIYTRTKYIFNIIEIHSAKIPVPSLSYEHKQVLNKIFRFLLWLELCVDSWVTTFSYFYFLFIVHLISRIYCFTEISPIFFIWIYTFLNCFYNAKIWKHSNTVNIKSVRIQHQN